MPNASHHQSSQNAANGAVHVSVPSSTRLGRPQPLASGGQLRHNQESQHNQLSRKSRLPNAMSSSGPNLAVAAADSAALEAEFERFESAWRAGSPPNIEQFLGDASSGAVVRDAAVRRQLLIELVAIDLERRWRASSVESSSSVGSDHAGAPQLPLKTRLEDYAQKFPALVSDGDVPIDLIVHEYRVRTLWGDGPSISEYLTRFPAQSDAVRVELTRIEREISNSNSKTIDPISDLDVYPVTVATPPPGAGEPASVSGEDRSPPERIGRFDITGTLGSGGFGVVYRGHDRELNRDVAIKVPRAECVAALGGTSAYLAEARNIASLDHLGIVPVYEVGCSDDGLCYVVSKLMPGGNLEQLIRDARPSYERSAELVACIAEGLHHAHGRGLVHRDIKPANILIDARGNPLLADFGLALHENDFGSGPGYVGTLTYMSPEQARVEGHLVDARSDIFSLGLVLFELLSGKLPYRSKSKRQLVAEITACEPRPVRQLDEMVPEELDRICQKARATRLSDRYSTAHDLAEDLRAFLRRRPKPSVPRWALPLAFCAATAVALVAFILSRQQSPSPTPVPTPVTLAAPYLEMDHLVPDPDGNGLQRVGITMNDIPLPSGEQVVLDVQLPKKQKGFVYMFQFDEGRAPKRLWPPDLARQDEVDVLQYPADGRGLVLDGAPRRIMFLAAVSPTRLGESDLKDIQSIAFSLEHDLRPEHRWHEFICPPDPQRPALRSSGLPEVVQLNPKRLSPNPERELQKHFDAFSALVFSVGTPEPK